MNRLAGKTALITGAARGIGRHFATAYVREGANVAIADIDVEGAARAAEELGSAAIAIELDVTSKASIDKGIDKIIEAFNGIDILVNNAAIFSAAPIADITREDYQHTFDVNVSGTLFTMQAVARHMIDRGIRGRIINMASQAGRRGESLVAVYCASKAAIISLTQSAGQNLISHGINVNAIAPGWVFTEKQETMWATPEAKAAFLQKQCLQTFMKPRDMVGGTLFLASDTSAMMTGQTIVIDAGVARTG